MNPFSDYGLPTRLSFPFDEAKNEWLPMLLDSYYQADIGVREAIGRQIKQGRSLACAKGCSSCCSSHTTIPVYPLEVVGIYWYVIEKMPKNLSGELKEKLTRHDWGGACPFLMNGVCVIHPMRFLACRHFNVFDTQCEEGEDAYFTRRKDVMSPLKKHQDQALAAMLPFHGIKKKADRKTAMKSGYIHQQAQVLQEIDWTKLASRIP